MQKQFFWNPNAEITITGYELDVIIDAMNRAIDAYKTMDDVLTRAVVQGKASAKYIGENGEELTEEAIQALSEKVLETLNTTN